MPYRIGSRPWRISQITSGGSFENSWPVLVVFFSIIFLTAVLIRFFNK